MNVQRIRELADRIETLDRGSVPGTFNMARFWHTRGRKGDESYAELVCTAPACIAGWACYYYGLPEGDLTVSEAAADHLGLPKELETPLFDPEAFLDEEELERPGADYFDWPVTNHKVSPAWAAATLRFLADRGVVNWGAARVEDRP